MQLSSSSTSDQINLPASNNAILASYSAAKEHMDKTIDAFLDKALRKPDVSAIPESAVYELFSLPYHQTLDGKGDYGDIAKNQPMEAQITLISAVMEKRLHLRGYQLLGTPKYGVFQIMKLEDYISNAMRSDANRIKPDTFKKDPGFIQQEIGFRTRKITQVA